MAANGICLRTLGTCKQCNFSKKLAAAMLADDIQSWCHGVMVKLVLVGVNKLSNCVTSISTMTA